MATLDSVVVNHRTFMAKKKRGFIDSPSTDPT